MTQTYDVGFATVDITPPVGMMLAGYLARNDPSTGVYHPLRAVAVAIDDGDGPVLFIGADILGFYEQSGPVRTMLMDRTGLPADRIVLNGSHTHCGPSLRAIDGERHGPLDMDYIERMRESMVTAAEKALAERAPATLEFAVGCCTLATHRRVPDPDNPGKVQRSMKPNYAGPHDHEVPVLVVRSPEGQVKGVLFNYACHPTSRGGTLIGADYPGFAAEQIEKRYPGATACFLQGCGGDQKPRPPDPAVGTYSQREVDQVRMLGEELAAGVFTAIESGSSRPVSGPIQTSFQVVTLLTEEPDLDWYKRSLEDDSASVREWAAYLLDKVERGEQLSREVPFDLQTVRFGDSVAMVMLAAEAVVEHALRLKKDLAPHFDGVMVLGYSNEVIGYLAVKRMIPEGGYEVISANQFHRRTGAYVPETEDAIHAAAHKGLGVW